jgi:hypothetical protein
MVICIPAVLLPFKLHFIAPPSYQPVRGRLDDIVPLI